MKKTDKEIIELRDKHMTYSGADYVYWKSRSFEHFNEPWEFFQKLEAMQPEIMKELREYVERILHIESLGLTPNTSTVVWNWTRFEGLTEANEYLPLLAKVGDIFHKSGELFAIVVGRNKIAMVENGRVVGTTEEEFPEGRYHHFINLGFKSLNVGQPKHNGLCYATTEQMLAFFKKSNIPVNL